MTDSVTCNCTAYPFPHRLGSGTCENTSIEGPICGECKCHCTTKLANMGIGPYEYWGQKGNDVDMQLISLCCHSNVYTDQTLSEGYSEDF